MLSRAGETDLVYQLHLVHDPQGFASELFDKHLQRQKMAYENRLLVLSLVTRLVGMVRSRRPYIHVAPLTRG